MTPATPRAGSPQTMPSRQFLLSQAIRDACVADNPLTAINGARVAEWLRWLTGNGRMLPLFFEISVCRAYHQLVSRYSENGAGE